MQSGISPFCMRAKRDVQRGPSLLHTRKALEIKGEQTMKFSIITCSDTRTEAEDTAGAALKELIAEQGWEVSSYQLVKDEVSDIEEAIVDAVDNVACEIVLTCGGTGLSLRDVTPEATMAVCDRNVPGIAEAMRLASLKVTPNAMLSRAVAMQRGKTVVINFPGSEKAARENWDAVVGALAHAVKMANGGGH